MPRIKKGEKIFPQYFLLDKKYLLEFKNENQIIINECYIKRLEKERLLISVANEKDLKRLPSILGRENDKSTRYLFSNSRVCYQTEEGIKPMYGRSMQEVITYCVNGFAGPRYAMYPRVSVKTASLLSMLGSKPTQSPISDASAVIHEEVKLEEESRSGKGNWDDAFILFPEMQSLFPTGINESSVDEFANFWDDIPFP